MDIKYLWTWHSTLQTSTNNCIQNYQGYDPPCFSCIWDWPSSAPILSNTSTIWFWASLSLLLQNQEFVYFWGFVWFLFIHFFYCTQPIMITMYSLITLHLCQGWSKFMICTYWNFQRPSVFILCLWIEKHQVRVK